MKPHLTLNDGIVDFLRKHAPLEYKVELLGAERTSGASTELLLDKTLIELLLQRKDHTQLRALLDETKQQRRKTEGYAFLIQYHQIKDSGFALTDDDIYTLGSMNEWKLGEGSEIDGRVRRELLCDFIDACINKGDATTIDKLISSLHFTAWSCASWDDGSGGEPQYSYPVANEASYYSWLVAQAHAYERTNNDKGLTELAVSVFETYADPGDSAMSFAGYVEEVFGRIKDPKVANCALEEVWNKVKDNYEQLEGKKELLDALVEAAVITGNAGFAVKALASLLCAHSNEKTTYPYRDNEAPLHVVHALGELMQRTENKEGRMTLEEIAYTAIFDDAAEKGVTMKKPYPSNPLSDMEQALKVVTRVQQYIQLDPLEVLRRTDARLKDAIRQHDFWVVDRNIIIQYSEITRR